MTRLESVSCIRPGETGTLLCVDDEANILSSLRRLFRAAGYHTLVAESAQAALQIMESEPVDLVISDMRMPVMDGARFLEKVRAKWPDTVRLLLTGYADVQSVLDAINRGEIYRYITKPWDDNDILLLVRHALERKGLEMEQRRLQDLTQRQNDELTALNATLEEKVAARTLALKKAHDDLLSSNEKLKNNFLTSIKVFSNMMEMRAPYLAGHSRRVADRARKIARKMELDTQETQEIFVAGLLHSIGKIGFSDELLQKPVTLMSRDELGLYCKYPVRGEQLLMPLEDVRGAAGLIRSHQERFDGKGYPDGLAGFDIPLGARILALANDYDNLQIGALSQRRLRPDEAREAIARSRGRQYDPAVVDAFLGAPEDACVGDSSIGEQTPARVASTSDLQAGMAIARDLVTRDGSLLLSAGHVLTDRLIRQIKDFEKSSGEQFTIYICL